MTKKDFEALATALKCAKPDDGSYAAFAAWKGCAMSIAGVAGLIAGDNEFSLETFLKACGVSRTPNIEPEEMRSLHALDSRRGGVRAAEDVPSGRTTSRSRWRASP